MKKLMIGKSFCTMKKSLDKIADDDRLAHGGLINKDTRLDEDEEKKKNISFSFKLFRLNSIRTSFFNNCYESRKKSIAASRYLFDSFSCLSEKTLGELEADTRLRERFRYHPINDRGEIERIEKVQIEGYMVNKTFIEQHEWSYYQFEFGPNGYRLIMTKLGAIFIPLFVDSNHLIYRNSSRDKEKKMEYKIPFVACDDYLKSCDEKDDFEFCKSLVEEFRSGIIESKEDFIAQWQAAYG